MVVVVVEGWAGGGGSCYRSSSLSPPKPLSPSVSLPETCSGSRAVQESIPPAHVLRQATCAVTRLPLFDESNSALLPLFLPNLSPRNTALVACVDRGFDGEAAPAWPWVEGG